MDLIDRASEKDFPAVLELLRQLWPDRALDSNIMREVYLCGLTSDRQVYLVARARGDVVGFGSLAVKNSLWQEGNLGHIDELVVDKNHRSRGIGGLMLERLISLAVEKGCRRIELDSAFHRNEAHQFYTRHGFENRAFLFSKRL